MIRLFKHYIPHAVLLLALVDMVLLMAAAEMAWRIRADQLAIPTGVISERLQPMLVFSTVMFAAMVAVGVYGTDALRSIRFASARLLVALSLGIIALALMNTLLGGAIFWRFALFYALLGAAGLLVLNRLLVGTLLGASAFRRRVLVLGAGHRADRLRILSEKPGSGFVIVGYVVMNEGTRVVEEAIARTAIQNLTRYVENLGVSEVVLALEERRNALPLKDLLRINARYLPQFRQSDIRRFFSK